jgi:UDP-glucose 4-epimerase
MKAIVTGGAGFIGHHLVAELISRGWFVHVVDDLSTGDFERLERLPWAQWAFHEVDIATQTLTDIKGVDALFHLAAPVSVVESLESPQKYRTGIVTVTDILLKYAKLNDIKHFIAASSAAIYGEPTRLPIEETRMANTLSPYADYKLQMESQMREVHSTKLQCTALRFFNVFGEGQSAKGGYASAVPIFLKQYESFLPITVTGTGDQTRDWIYVGDVCDALIKSSQFRPSNEMSIYNVGSGIETSVIEVAESFSGEIVHIESRLEPNRSVADITKITRELDWRPRTNLLSWIKEIK